VTNMIPASPNVASDLCCMTTNVRCISE
jgi:hypothetical protein